MATCKHCGKPPEAHHKAGDGQLRCPVASSYEEAEEPRQDRREPGTAQGDMRYDSGKR